MGEDAERPGDTPTGTVGASGTAGPGQGDAATAAKNE